MTFDSFSTPEYIGSMAKKRPQPKPDPDPTIKSLRLKDGDELERFKRAADLEGFSTTSAWMLYHLRRQSRETLERLSAAK